MVGWMGLKHVKQTSAAGALGLLGRLQVPLLVASAALDLWDELFLERRVTPG